MRPVLTPAPRHPETDVLLSPAGGAFAAGREAERLALALEAAGFGEWEFDLGRGGFVASPLYVSMFGFRRTSR